MSHQAGDGTLSPAPPAASGREPAGQPPGWPRWVFRCCVSINAVLVFDQAVFAGQFLAGSYGSLALHRDNGILAASVMLVTTAAAVLQRWPGRGPRWPIGACLGLFALLGVQVGLGFSRVLAVHVPMGVAIIALTVLLTVWAWRSRPATESPGAQEKGPRQ